MRGRAEGREIGKAGKGGEKAGKREGEERRRRRRVVEGSEKAFPAFPLSRLPDFQVSVRVRLRKISSSGAPRCLASRLAGVSSTTTLPREMMMIRVQMASTSSRMWVERI